MFNVKKVLVATLCVTMTFSLAACSVGKKKSKNLVSSQGEASSSKRGEYKSKVTKLADYKSLTIGESSVEVTDEFKANVKSTFLSSSTMNINTEHVGKADRAVETGDVVNIDYVGKIDGKEFDGGSAEGYNLQIGSSTFIDGFEDGLVGAKPGETKDLNLKFPDEYGNEDVAGKDVVFTVTVNYIEDFSDEFIKDNTENFSYFFLQYFSMYEKVSNLDEYNKTLEKCYKANVAVTQLMENIVDNSEVEFDDNEVNSYIEKIKKMYTEQAEQYGTTFEDMLSNYGYTEDYFNEQCKKSFKQIIILNEIAKENEISIDNDDYNEVIQCVVDNSNGQYATIADYEEAYDKTDLWNSVLFAKVYVLFADVIKVVPDEEATTYISPDSETEAADSTEETTVAAESDEAATEETAETSETAE